jgi:hypothetical protein
MKLSPEPGRTSGEKKGILKPPTQHLAREVEPHR